MKKVLKFIYNIIPFKKQFFSFLRNNLKFIPSFYHHLTFKGTFEVCIEEKNNFFKMFHYGYMLENEVFWLGIPNGWEKESTKLWIELSKQSNTILDIGSNTGLYALISKSVNPQANVFAFEPVDRVYKKLIKNIELNHYNITAIKKAASNSDGKAVIYDTDAEHLYSVTVNKNLTPGIKDVFETKIDVIKLSTFIKENNIQGIDLIKLDVETHEPQVLEGMEEFLKLFKPTLLIEVLEEEDGKKIEAILNDLDYLYFNINEKTGPHLVQHIGKSDDFNYLVCSENTAKQLGIIK